MTKTFLIIMVGMVILTAGCNKQPADSGSASRMVETSTFSSFDPPRSGEKLLPARTIQLENADLNQVMNLYAQISGRSVLRAEKLPEAKITLFNQTPMSNTKALQALDTALAVQGVAAVIQGTQYVKMVSEKEACTESGPIIELAPDQLPNSSSFLIYIVRSKKGLGNRVLQALAPFSKLPNSIIFMPGGPEGIRPLRPPAQVNIPQQIWDKLKAKDDVLILRDYSTNVKAMLRVLETLQ